VGCIRDSTRWLCGLYHPPHTLHAYLRSLRHGKSSALDKWTRHLESVMGIRCEEGDTARFLRGGSTVRHTPRTGRACGCVERLWRGTCCDADGKAHVRQRQRHILYMYHGVACVYQCGYVVRASHGRSG
jgi:hypothetical protein